MLVKEVMNRKPVAVGAADSIMKAAQIMGDGGVGCLVVANAGTVKGILTDRDIVVRCTGSGHNPRDCQVGQHMTGVVITASPLTDTVEAAHLMTEKRVKRLPIVDGGKLVGLVSFSDIAQAMDQPMHDLLMGMGAARRNA